MANVNLSNAKRAKNDEFYTQLSDIENELKHYKNHFAGKVVYCNCDDARESNFFRFFQKKFSDYGLKKLITTSYNENGHGSVLVYEGDTNGNGKLDDNEVKVSELKGNGDFRSEECIELLKEADIVVTNPPFSLFREYIATLVQYDKKFIILGNQNAITYKEIFPLIKENKLWYGYSIHSGGVNFYIPKHYETSKNVKFDENGKRYINLAGIRWFTNLDHSKRHEDLILYKKYTAEEFPKYDNYDAIEVSKTSDIPMDYDGIIGVPITFLDKFNPSQFEIVDPRDFTNIERLKLKNSMLIKDKDSAINGKPTYARIAIRKK